MKRWQIILGIGLILMGILALVEALFKINLWRFICPLLLIGLGILLILRPRMAGEGVQVQMPILGDVRKTGVWEATSHEIWILVGSNRLDFSEALFPERDAVVKIYGLVADVKIILPDDVGLRVNSTSIVSQFRGLESKEEQILSTLTYETPHFSMNEKRVTVLTLAIVSDIKVKSALI